MSRGLVIGKFMPPHAGHLYLCGVAAGQVDQLHVILFSKAREPIPGALRLAWLRELLPQAAIWHIDQEHRVDFDDAGAWDFWVSAIRSVLPCDPDMVFSSEPYGDELARRLGARHVAVDPARAQVPISASQIRVEPLAHWPHIPPAVRPYFVRRVAIVGAECTGKTSLAQALAEALQTVWVPEYARGYLLTHGQRCTRDDLLVIAREQAASEERLARQANRVLVCDTDLLTTRLWHEHYFGDCPVEIEQMARERSASLSLLCSPDIRWKPDGVRDAPDSRGWFHERFQAELRALGRPFLLLAGSPEQRLAQAIDSLAPQMRDNHPKH